DRRGKYLQGRIHRIMKNRLTDRILPKQSKATPSEGSFVITSDTRIDAGEASMPRAKQFADMPAPAMGQTLQISSATQANNCIALRIDPNLARLGDEGYRATITPQCAELTARTTAGIFWGIQTVRQLLPDEIFSSTRADGISWEIPCGSIEDS